MANVTGKKNKRNKAFNLLLLFGLFVALSATFVVTEHYQVDPTWVFASVSAAVFFAVVGWGYRRLFRSPAFMVFFGTWTLVHVAINLLVLAYLGFFYYVPIAVIELWVGYTVAILWFGPPRDRAGGN